MPSTRPPEPHRDLHLFTKIMLVVVIVVPNVVGAAVVLVLMAWVLPTGPLLDDPAALPRNLVTFAIYLLAAVLLGVVWGTWRMRIPTLPPEADEKTLTRHDRRVRRVVLRGPVRLATVQAVLWALAVPVFVLANVFSSVRLALSIGLTVVLAGIATVAVTYRFCEIVLRREVARILASRPPAGRVLPGVALRAVGAWALGTAIPLLGLCLAAGAALLFGDYSVTRLGIVVLVLGAVALAVGGLVTVLTATSTAAPILAVRRALGRVEQGDYTTTVPVFDTTELGLLQAGFNTMVSGLRERERVRDLFGRHVGEDVARAALEHDVDFQGETREVAVLFVDLVGSTTLAASRPAHEVVTLLNEFFAVVIDVVERNDGWINKFEGDAALAVFGAPSPLPDAAGSALRAGRVLAARLGAELDGVSAGIGVSAGDAVAGNIGDTSRYEYTVIGDPVNEAARLTEAAKEVPGGVVASGAAVERAGAAEAKRWRENGSRSLRGRTEETALMVPGEHAPGGDDRTAGEPVDGERAEREASATR